MNRAAFVRSTLVAPLAAASAAAPAWAAENTTVTTQLLWIKDVEYGGFWIADANGYFRDEGIAPVFLGGGPNLSSVEAVVASGRADVGVDEFEKVVDAVAHGADFVVLGAVFQRGIAGFLSLPKNPIRTAKDLIGKRLGLPQGARQFVDAVFRVNGLTPNYTEVPVGFDPQPLVEGACDGYLCYVTNQPLILAKRKIPYVVTPLAQLGYAVYAGAIFAQRDYVAKNRATLVRYVRAVARGWEANRRDPRLAAQLAVDRYGAGLGLDLDQQIAQSEAQVPLTESDETRRKHGLLWVSREHVEKRVYPTLRAAGRTKLPEFDRLFDLSILRDATAREKHG
jgi:ABC-type nitrate/sulfonate/bicarbonate transport system substrate-binding protein